jgi:hypothetical protein
LVTAGLCELDTADDPRAVLEAYRDMLGLVQAGARTLAAADPVLH